MRRLSLNDVAAPLALAALLALAWWAYRAGLDGGFLFDDFGTLPELGATGPINNAGAFWRYITAGSGDPTGRPIAMLSFLIDANNWPADPYPFKRTSILLHMLNGVLLTWLLLRLGRVLRIAERQAEAAAVLGAGLWLLHPLFVSTTLYIVQREAMLPATFILIGLLGYLAGRNMAVRGYRHGVWLAGFFLVACTTLAVLSKANGALLPMLALLIESVVLSPRERVSDQRTRRFFAWMRVAILVVPSALLLAYLGKEAWSGFVHGVDDIRPWTLGQRLLTEARVLVEYLGLLWLPRPYTAGLFNDAITASKSLWSPGTTLPAMILIGALIAGAIALRRKHPALALAILFFFVAHIMESTVIALELYFEHRNYIPALLMFWPLALWLCGASIPTATSRSATAAAAHGFDSRSVAKPGHADLPGARAAIALALPLLLAALTLMRAELWGHPQEQALIWALKNPDSPRAQAYAAQMEMDRGENAAAVARLEKALAAKPDEIQLALNLIGARCATGGLSRADVERAAYALRNAPNAGRLGYDWFDRSLPTAQAGTCRGLDLTTVGELLVAVAANERTRTIPGRRQDVLHLQGRVALLHNDEARALELFDAALQADVRPGAALDQAAILASAGKPQLALRHLDLLERIWHPPSRPGFTMRAIHDWLLGRQGYWSHEITHLRSVIADDLASRAYGDKDNSSHGAISPR